MSLSVVAMKNTIEDNAFGAAWGPSFILELSSRSNDNTFHTHCSYQ
jgi:hypothetical protein